MSHSENTWFTRPSQEDWANQERVTAMPGLPTSLEVRGEFKQANRSWEDIPVKGGSRAKERRTSLQDVLEKPVRPAKFSLTAFCFWSQIDFSRA